jgi:ketosteroid isomerase-like protein
MKLITSLVGIAALNFVTSAPAQPEEAVSPGTNGTPSATIEETPTAAPESKLPAGSDIQMRVTAVLKNNENRWFAAIAKHDTATIESMLAADFVSVDPTGTVQDRRATLAEVKNDKNAYISMKTEQLDVHLYGSGVAVVIGTASEKRPGKDGKILDLAYRFTDAWMNRTGYWQCIASQSMLMRPR